MKIKLQPVKKIVSVVFFLFLAASPVAAQDIGTVSGRVVNQNGDPISGATVLGTVPGNTIYNVTAITTGDGRFYLAGLSLTDYTLVVSMDGYIPTTAIAHLSDLNTTISIGNIALRLRSDTPPVTDSPPSYSPPVSSGLDCRPFACDACNQTSFMTGSCATSFTVNDQISYRKSEGEQCTDGQWWVQKDWRGTVSIDPTRTTIPFVGKEGQENEERYLADYFEGTDKYYTFYDDPLQMVMHSGVWRKLAPQALQDEYRRKMVLDRISCGSEGNVHDYTIRSSAGETATLSTIAAHMPPPNTSPNYLADYLAWKETDDGLWYRLWQSVPMFSREDTPGSIVPQAGIRSPDQFTHSSGSLIEKVPHVARLYDGTKAINTLLTPYQPDTASADNQQGAYLASTERFSPNENGKTLLAQAFSASMNLTPEITPTGGNNYSVCWVFQAMASCGVYDLSGPLTVAVNGGVVYAQNWGPVGYSFPYHCSYLPFGGPVNVTASVGDTITVCAVATNANHHCDQDPRPYLNACVSCQINADGSTTCGTGTPPPPACGLPNPPGVAACDKEALRDTNPNDGLCCNTINYSLKGTDAVVNPYAPCTTITIPPGCGDCVDTNLDGTDDWCCRPEVEGCVDNEHGVSVCQRLPPNSCDDVVTVGVSRGVAVGLAHPYLSEIWDYSSDEETGFFNIFRPDPQENFKDLDAASDIYYGYTPGSATPSTGSFYYPYLGGIQKAKEWVSLALYPYPLTTGDATQIGYTPPGTPPSDQPTGSLQQILNAAAAASGVDAKILAAILAIESPTHYSNPASTYCPISPCGATGPMQILTGSANVNCDPSQGSICTGWCSNGVLTNPGAFDPSTWDSYADQGMDPCNLADSMVVAGRLLRAKAGGPISLSDVVSIVRASKSYYGEQYSSSLSPAENCHNGEKFARLGNRTYCEYVFWHGGIESLIN